MIRVSISDKSVLFNISRPAPAGAKTPAMSRFPILALVLGVVTLAGATQAQAFPNDEASVRYRRLIEQLPPSERPRPHDPRWTTNAISPSTGRFGLPLSGPAARGGMTAFH